MKKEVKDDLISRKALLKHLSDWWLSETPSGEVVVINNEIQKTFTNEIIEQCIKAVEEQPTVDSKPVVYGYDRWHEFEESHCEFWCSVCGFWIGEIFAGDCDGDFNYCPNCGARLAKLAKIERLR